MPGATTTLVLDIAGMRRMANTIRQDIIRMTGAAGSGHPTSSFSAVEALMALYFRVLRHDPANPTWPDRDRLVLSKGHAAPVLYSLLARCGYFPVAQLMTLRKLGSPLQGHPELGRLSGVEASTGSLGQGVSIGIGMALAARVDGKPFRTYVLIGDGENDEGQIWEAALFASHYRVDNLTVIRDSNALQQDGWVKDIMNQEPIGPRWAAFGWHVIEGDGHDLNFVLKAYEEARAMRGRPTVIIARTIKGKGVSFMEHKPELHGIAPTPTQVEHALREWDEERRRLEAST